MDNVSPVDRLINMGFRKVGEWQAEGVKIRFILDVDAASIKNVLYAFVCQGTVVYIGKTVRSLRQRMSGYKNPSSSQSTNIKGNKLIIETLAKNISVLIFALPDNGLLYYGGFHINLAAGLEDSMVSALKPAWNRMGV